MSTDLSRTDASPASADSPPARAAHARRHAELSDDSRLATEIRELVERGQMDEARASIDASASTDPEHRLLARELRARLSAAIDRLDGRQRTVFTLCHYGDFTPREIAAMTGLNESTVRVHLFRAARKLRGLLGGKP